MPSSQRIARSLYTSQQGLAYHREDEHSSIHKRMPDLDLTLLLDRALKGDERAKTKLVEVLRPDVRLGVVAALRLGRRFYPSDLTDDLVQDTLEVLFKDQGAVLRKFDPRVSTGNFAAYVTTIATRTVTSKLRTKKSGRDEVATAPEDFNEGTNALMDPEGAIARRDLLFKVIDLLPKLGVKEDGLELFQLHFVDGYRGVEISAFLGLEEDAVHQRLHRMRQVVQKIINKLETPRRQS